MYHPRHLLGLFIICFSFNAFAQMHPINLALGAAIYTNSDGNEVPFILKGNAAMTAWQFSDKFTNLPPGIKFFISESISCSDQICFAVGGYTTLQNPNKINAVVLRSVDEGLSWTINNVTPPNTEKADLKNISCDNNLCIATGYYYENNFNKKPYILISQNNFQTWQQITDIAGFDKSNTIDSIQFTCTNEYCVIAAALYDKDEDAEKPLFFFSGKDKKTWAAASLTQAAAFNRIVNFSGVSCSNRTCAAVGFISDQPNRNKPLLYVSEDKGLTWNKKTIDEDFGNLHTVKCKNNFCIAAGTADSDGHQNKGLLITSQDQGHTWHPISLVTPENHYFYITNSDCTNNYCVIGGDYYNPPYPNQFFLYVSYDQGKSWSQIQNIDNLPEIDILLSTGLSCNAENCLYTLEDGNTTIRHTPIIVISDASGQKWQSISNLINIPDGLNVMFVDTNYHDAPSTIMTLKTPSQQKMATQRFF